MDLFKFDRSFVAPGEHLAGVDEAGRGPWAGPVVAAAVVLPDGAKVKGLNDSKKLTPEQREKIFGILQVTALSIGVGIVSREVIDDVNILEATRRAMRAALEQLTVLPRRVLVDGNLPIPGLTLPQEAVVDGDARSAAVAAASVVAKVTRDRLMIDLALTYPQYGFERHKGYGTPEHWEALKKFGPCPLHRQSFSPVRDLLSGDDHVR